MGTLLGEEVHCASRPAPQNRWIYTRTFSTSEQCFQHLSNRGVTSFATSPHIKGLQNKNLTEIEWASCPAVAVWFGNERKGLSEYALSHCAMCVQHTHVWSD